MFGMDGCIDVWMDESVNGEGEGGGRRGEGAGGWGWG